jgi:hypothetical protein
VNAIIQQRLLRLSPDALRAVKAAAVLQSDFDLGLVAEVLQTDPLALIGAWEELEGAHIFSGGHFSHDLLFEGALDTVSEPVRVLLNRRSAEVLEVRGANPARVARHWLAAGEELAAVPFLRRAAQQAVGEMRVADAERGWEQAVDILSRHARAAELREVRAEWRARLVAPAE